MTVDIAASLQGRLADPILMEWALSYYADAAKRDAEYAAELRRCWFDRDCLQGWLGGDDDWVLDALFTSLPVSVFEPLAELISEHWPGWSDRVAEHSAQTLAELAPERAAALFSSRIAGAEIDSGIVVCIIKALPALPAPDAKQLIELIAGTIMGSDAWPGSYAALMTLGQLQTIAMRLDPPAALRLIGARVSSEREPLEEVLHGVFPGPADYEALVELAHDRRSGDSRQRLTELAPLFQPQAPLTALDRLVMEAATPGDVLPLVADCLSESDGGLIAELLALMPAELSRSGNDELIAILIALVAAAAGLEQLDADGLSLDEVLALLAADLRRVPHRDVLLERLQSFDRGQVVAALLQAFQPVRKQYGGIELVVVMGELGWQEFVTPIIAAMSADGGDFICDQGELSLARIGAPAQAELIRRWDELDYSQRIYGWGVIERVAGDAATEFLLAGFDTLFEDDAESWCRVAARAPDPRLLQCLQPYLEYPEIYVSKCYYIIANLLGIDDDQLDQLSRQMNVLHALQGARQAAARDGESLTADLTLAMRCADCGSSNQYRVSSVIYSPQTQQPFVLGEETACASCGGYTELAFTDQANTLLVARAMSPPSSIYDGPDLFKRRELPHLGRRHPLGEVLDYCRAALQRDPQDPAALIRQGICYRDGLSRPRRAQGLFEQALQAQPLAAEATLALANQLVARGQYVEALAMLDEALANKQQWRFFVTDMITPAEHGRLFAGLYNRLIEVAGISGRDQLAADFLGVGKKVGRNDPCPCGSGKKYKKCCLKRG